LGLTKYSILPLLGLWAAVFLQFGSADSLESRAVILCR
jgi:hypothetical protein